MGARLGWLAALAAWAVVPNGCSAGSPESVGVGDRFGAVHLSGERPALVWVLDVEQCLGCELSDPARVVRGLQHGLGDGLETVVLAVGDGRDDDHGIVDGFLASERVVARVEMRRRDRYPRESRGVRPSVLYVVNRDSEVEAVVANDSVEVWRSEDGLLDLAGFVARLAER